MLLIQAQVNLNEIRTIIDISVFLLKTMFLLYLKDLVWVGLESLGGMHCV